MFVDIVKIKTKRETEAMEQWRSTGRNTWLPVDRTAVTVAGAEIFCSRRTTICLHWLISVIKENIMPPGEKMAGETGAPGKMRRIW